MKHTLTALAALAMLGASARAEFFIDTATDPFEVSFRGEANTTYFGWSDGTFDGSSEDETIDNPPVTLGTDPGGVSLTQLTAGDFLASSNNIYNGAGPNSNPAALNFVIPIDATGAADAAAGFTTIIIQGRAVNGGMPGLTTPPSFSMINGVAPTVVWGGNLNGKSQWWVKYEIPGNSALYVAQIALVGGSGIAPTSIANLQIDTQWSAESYAADTAAVTEPAPEPPVAGASVSVIGKKNRTTKSSKAVINGFAMSGSTVTGVYYSVGDKAIRTATGTDNWSFKTHLKPGRNVIRVFAVDSAGSISSDQKVVVTRK